MSCMVGVTCFPDPHIERDTHAAEHLDPALERYLDGLARACRPWPGQRRPRHAGLLRCYARSRPQPAPMKVQASALPPTHLPGIALPADEADLRRYDNDDWRSLALPDGSLLALARPHRHRRRKA